MYKLKVKCSCGASLELEFDRHLSITVSSAYDKFLKAHVKCREYFHSDTDPIAADPDVLNRLDELNI